MDAPTPTAERRRRLAAALQAAGGGVAVVPTAAQALRNGDVEHPYRHGSDFHYLTGFDEPDAWLVLDAQGRSTLFLRPRDPEREIWDGPRLGVDDAPAVLGIDQALPVSELDRALSERLAGEPAVWLPYGGPDTLRRRADGWIEALRGQSRFGVRAPQAVRDLRPLLDEMRLVKDALEIDTLRRAAEISAAAHLRAMRRAAAQRYLAPGTPLREYQLEAELLYEFRRQGAQAPAYPSIVAAGANTCVLHYAAGEAALQPGALCLIDAGCELDGYASDITRTWPVDGRFSGPQRTLYELVLAAQEAAVEVTRPGARKQDAHWAAVGVISQGLLDLGLLDRAQVGGLDDVIETAAYRRYFMHGTGHWLGRDVHDVGEYLAIDEPEVEQRDGMGRRVVRAPSRPLVPGMAITIEPGLYVRPADDIPAHWWHIGIRIEDDAIVTPGGCELISRGVPVAPDAIEAVMRDLGERAAEAFR